MSTYSFHLRRAAYIVVFIVVIFIVSLIYTWINPLPEPECRNQSVITKMGTNSISIRNKRGNLNEYFIKTSACKILRTDIINNKVMKMMDIFHFKIFRKPYCHYLGNKYKPPLAASNQTNLFILHKATKYYLNTQYDNLQCFYAPFWKTKPDDHKTHIEFGLKTHFIDSVVVPPATEFIRVICTSNNTQVYEDYFTFVPNKHNFHVSSKPKLNVLIFGLDSLFRENFHREMPQTAKTLKKLNFIEFSGYTRISENKFSNLIALFTGYNELELQSVCWPEISEYFDKCPFIWQKYRDQNYNTAFAEDNSGMSLFTSWGKSGFINPPADHYYYPFGKKVSETISREYYGIPRFCFGSKRSIDLFLDYSTKLVTNLKEAPLFGVLLASTISHDYLNLPRISDLEFQQLFNFMNDTNFLETSIIIFMGDCGLSWDPNMKTKTRRLESKMPLFTVSFPKWFPQKYPLAYKYFVTNSKRLTNHFDFYETLSCYS